MQKLLENGFLATRDVLASYVDPSIRKLVKVGMWLQVGTLVPASEGGWNLLVIDGFNCLFGIWLGF